MYRLVVFVERRARRLSWRPVQAAILILACAFAAAAQVPYPELAGVEARVREKVDEAHRAVEAESGSAETWGRYGIVLDAHHLPVEAAAAYREAARLDAGDARWSYFLATLLEYQDPTEAVSWYEKAVRLRPSYAPARIRYGQTLEAVGRDADAEVEYRRATELDPSNPLGPFGLGRLALADNRVPEAVRHLERAYRLGSGIQAVVATLARVYARSGQMEVARQKAAEARGLPRTMPHKDPLRAAVHDEAVDTESFLLRSRTYADVGDLRRARREIEELLSFAPDLAQAWFAAAGIYDRQGAADEALEAAQRALGLEPGLAGARQVVAGALFKLGRFEEAETIATEILDEAPDNLHMLVLVAMGAAERGAVDEMIRHLDHAYAVRTRETTLGPVLAQLFADLANAFADVGRFVEAAERMGQALDVAQEAGATPQQLREYRQQLERYRAHP